VACDRPKECREFTRDRHDDNSVALTPRHQTPVSRTKTRLCLPSDPAYSLWKVSLPLLVLHAQTSRMAVGPGRLDKGFARIGIPRLGDPTQAPRFACRAFGRNQAEKSHQLPRVVKSPKIAGLGNYCHRSHRLDPAHGLECRYDRRHRPCRNDFQ
jgi:hypothetical protein